MSDPRPILRLIETGSKRKRATVWTCAACKSEGRESGPVIEVYCEAYLSDGQATPGIKRLACLACIVRGKLTLI